MKKQFFRVKQLADQTFSRAGKTEALSDDLAYAEKRIESLNKTCQNISKKITATLLGLGQDVAAREKRLNKSQEYILAEVLSECGSGDLDEILKLFLLECGEILEKLARFTVDTDTRIETAVLSPLQHIIDVDVPNIMKQKRNLTRLILDMDSAKNRYQAAVKHTANSNSAGSVTKAESIKDELEDIETKVEQCRDALACDMFQLISKEAIVANVLLDYIKLQQAAHRAALVLLDTMVPELESKIKHSNMKPVFGIMLEEHLTLSNRKIAYPLELCVCVLLELGLEEEGIFRMNGGTSKVRRLRYGLDVNFVTMDVAMEYRDVHVFSSVLKTYFRELPEPLLTYSLYEEWLSCVRCYGDDNAKLSALWTTLHKLPQANYDNLRYFIKFLSLLSKKQEINKMSPQNLAIVIAPNLIWSPRVDSSNIGENMNLANLYSSIVEYLVKYADWFFPDEEKFYVTIEEVTSRTKTHMRSNSADLRLINAEFSITDSSLMKRCQSTTSLEEQIQNCPLPESPKPIIRTRKNKPAPVPPSIATSGGESNSATTSYVTVSTISSAAVTSPKEKSVRVTVQHTGKKRSTHETSFTTDSCSVSRENSFNSADFHDKSDSSIDDAKDNNRPTKNKATVEESSPPPANVAKFLAPESLPKIQESKKQAKPVPAPRISLEGSVRAHANDESTPKKPVIPEKPTTLPRPFSCTMKTIKISDMADTLKSDVSKGRGPSLEKAHLYSVDKQQVSFIDIASSPEEDAKNDASPIAYESRTINSVANIADQNHGTNRLSSVCSKNDHDGGKHSPKTEKKENDRGQNVSSKRENDRGPNSSHTRALSDGHNIDTVNRVNALPQKLSIQRMNLPFPPPPPPSAKCQSRPGSTSDSTNL